MAQQASERLWFTATLPQGYNDGRDITVISNFDFQTNRPPTYGVCVTGGHFGRFRLADTTNTPLPLAFAEARTMVSQIVTITLSSTPSDPSEDDEGQLPENDRELFLEERELMKTLNEWKRGYPAGSNERICVSVAFRAMFMASVGKIIWKTSSDEEQAKALDSFARAHDHPQCPEAAKQIIKESYNVLAADGSEAGPLPDANDKDDTDINNNQEIRDTVKQVKQKLFSYMVNGTTFPGEDPGMSIIDTIRALFAKRIGWFDKVTLLGVAHVCFPEYRFELHATVFSPALCEAEMVNEHFLRGGNEEEEEEEEEEEGE